MILFLKYYNELYPNPEAPFPFTTEPEKSSIIFLKEVKDDLQIILEESSKMQIKIYDHFEK